MEIEIEHWERLYRLAQEYPTPFMSHALEYYVKREGASQKDIRQELAVLNEIEKELEEHKNEKRTD